MYDDPRNQEKAKRYVIYLRKSQDDPSRQIRSIGDQTRECLEVAKRFDIKIDPKKDIISDERSAKRSGNRPNFTQMIKDIKKGKIDGLIAWAPDRLARNMKEGGEIIDLLDEGYIVDLKFASMYFTNDHAGKMSLGMSFVWAKQYSDKLSVDVKRGLSMALKEGKSAGQYKPGYFRSNFTGYYEPDESTTESGMMMFELVKNAWRKKLNGESNAKITRYLNERGYRRVLKSTGEKQKMSETKLSTMFDDSFYHGVLVQAGKEIDLNDRYEFIPMVSEEEFIAIKNLKKDHARVDKKHSWPFKNILICEACGNNLTGGASKGPREKVKALRYWCTKCKGGTIRAKVIIEAIDEILSNLKGGKEEYELYKKESSKFIESKRKALTKELAALKKLERKTEREYEKYIQTLALRRSNIDQDEKKILEKAKNNSKTQLERYKDQISKTKAELNNNIQLTLEKFLNTIESLSESFLFGSAETKDRIAQSVILNTVINKGEIIKIKLKEPFATMLQKGNLKGGGPGWI